MSTQAAVNLSTYNLSLLTAKEDILNPRSSTNWALFTYEGISNKLKLADSGAGGVAELVGKFHVAKPQYGLCRMGQKVDDYRRTECSSHVAAVKNFFKESHVFITAETAEQITEELIAAEHSKASQTDVPVYGEGGEQWWGFSQSQLHDPLCPLERVRRTSRSTEKEETVREEEQRKEEERRRVLEDRRRLERERVQNERRESDERDRKMNEKLQLIEEQRRKQAQKEEELRGHEKARWMQQQREHEDDMRARLRRSESIEMAA
ncbi:hypothetical protein CRUP_024086, partial [Coryphaenoides rupestris]